jgi:hypothetical protein
MVLLRDEQSHSRPPEPQGLSEKFQCDIAIFAAIRRRVSTVKIAKKGQSRTGKHNFFLVAKIICTGQTAS